MDRTPRKGSTDNPEVPDKRKRRRFDAAYKLRMLEEADRCTESGQLGELLRREELVALVGLAATARRRRAAGTRAQAAWTQVTRKDPVALENERLQRENHRLAERLRQAETIIEFQKSLRNAGDPLSSPSNDETS